MVKDYEKTKYWELVQEFLHELETAKYWMKPDGKPNPEWALFEGDTINSARSTAVTARDAVLSNDNDIAQDAAWDDAWDAAKDATATRTAARTAAWDAAWRAAQTINAAWDASLFATMLVCTGLPIAQEHLAHCAARMQVWRKGYCLLCDVNGKLYVYAQKGKE